MILSHTQIEEIAAAVTKDFNEFFFGKRAAIQTYYAQAAPIDQLAGDYLGLRVSFARLSDDGSICGLTAYTDTEYAATYRGVTRLIPLKANEVLLDSSFMEPGQVRARCGKRRFTLAHEALNISLDHLRKIEGGQRGCSVDLLIALAAMFDVSLDFLVLGRGGSVTAARDKLQTLIDELTALKEGL